MHVTITLACFIMAATAIGLFGIIKGCDWLIGLKYLSKDDYKEETAHLNEDLAKKFATVESHRYLKEDMDEIKTKLNDIHSVIMNMAVSNINNHKE